MGYNTYYSFYLQLKPGLTDEEFKEKLAKALKEDKTDTLENWNDIQADGGNIDVFDGARSTGGDDSYTMFEFLAPLVTKGTIDCSGDEDEDLWRVDFDGVGGFKEKMARVTYEDEYEDFIQRHKDTLPPTLLKQLETWRTITKI